MAIDLNKVIGSTVRFETYAPQILGTAWTRVKIVGFMDVTDAQRYARVAQLHASVLPSLPSGVTPDSSQLQYFKVLLPNGDITAVALPWIIDNTFTIDEGSRRCIVDLSDVSINDEARLRKLLLNNDFVINSISFRN